MRSCKRRGIGERRGKLQGELLYEVRQSGTAGESGLFSVKNIEYNNQMSTNIFNQLEPISKRDRIVAVVKETIISGKMNSGDPIVESQLARQLGVGQPLVREALIELEHQGFVQRRPYRGTYVTKLSREDIEQIFRLRAELETLAAQWAKEYSKQEDIEALGELVEGMREGAKDLNLEKFYENDLAFHRKMWELSGNKYLVEALERIVIPLFAFFVMKTQRIRESYIQSAAMHEKIVDALGSTNTAGMRQLMGEVLGSFKDEMLTRLLPKSE